MGDLRINDEVIEEVATGLLRKLDFIYIIPSLWVRIYFETETDRIYRALAKVDINKKFIFFPVHVDSMKHWFLMAYDAELHLMVVYDSLRKTLEGHQMHARIFGLMKNYGIVSEQAEMAVDEEYPQQKDGYSCGYRVLVAIATICKFKTLLNRVTLSVYNQSIVNFI